MTLGEILKASRKKAGLRAQALIEKADLRISPPQLSYYESGKRLPKPEELERLSKFLGIPLKKAFGLWAKAQMPTEKLRELFGSRESEDSVEVSPGDIKTYPAPLTISLDSRDAEFFNENPLAMTLLSRTLFASLKKGSCTAAELAEGLGEEEEPVLKVLLGLKERRYVLEDEGGYFRTPPGKKFIYPPSTPEFEPMRQARMKKVYDMVLKSTAPNEDGKRPTGFRHIMGKPMTEEQRQHFTDRLESIFLEIMELPNDPDPKEQTKMTWFVGALGRTEG